MDIVLEIDGVRYKHVQSEKVTHCKGCELFKLCIKEPFVFDVVCFSIDKKKGPGKFIKA